MNLFVTCSPGLENILAAELNQLGFSDTKNSYCGVYVNNASITSVYHINYCSRIAGRVLWPLIEFKCFNKDDLYKNIKRFDWSVFFNNQQTLAIDANINHHNLKNSLFAAQVMKDAICDSLKESKGFRPFIDLKNPDIQLNLFIYDNKAVVSFDTSGAPLYKRGYKTYTGQAPIQESLAASLLKIANYQGDEVFIDPCCGSGTILIEAAMMASDTPAGYFRKSWGFFNHPDFNEQEWLKIKQHLDSKKKILNKNLFWGIEREPEIGGFCLMNIKNTGFSDVINISNESFINHTAKASYNFLLTNPPHGKRIADELSLVPIYRALGDFMKQKMALVAKGFIFTSNKMLAKEIGLASKRRHIIKNSNLEARLLEFDIYNKRSPE